MNRIEYYSSLIPREIRNAFEPLDGDLAWALFVYLRIKDKKNFSGLMEEFKLDSPKLAYQLKRLQKGGLIEGYFEKRPKKRAYSYYSLSTTGNSLFEFIYALAKRPVEPDVQITKTESEISKIKIEKIEGYSFDYPSEDYEKPYGDQVLPFTLPKSQEIGTSSSKASVHDEEIVTRW